MNLATLMACATCHLALTEQRDGQRITYRHPVGDDAHPVIPVHADRLQQVFNRCHTCTGAPPVWNYRTGLIAIVAVEGGTVQTYNDQWHVCYRCAQLIEADDSEALTAHCAGLMHWLPGSDEYTILNTLHRGIVLGREGRTLLTTTDWPAARITADMLPKVRDRLTGLLRGPATLPAPFNDLALRRSLAGQLDLAPLYWINHEFTDPVQAVSEEQPTARITDDLVPSPAGLLAWPTPVGDPQRLAAVSWTPQADGWHVVGYRSIGHAVEDDLMPPLRHEIGWLTPVHAEHIARRTALDGRHPPRPARHHLAPDQPADGRRSSDRPTQGSRQGVRTQQTPGTRRPNRMHQTARHHRVAGTYRTDGHPHARQTGLPVLGLRPRTPTAVRPRPEPSQDNRHSSVPQG
ncbi:hypothetical protein OHA21_00110 [Actinoplanes sp. NBC_00393]|uniref:hypothetical protein n=1 Tax=Actinoplanes sp. NBC_00393 TaxID=2975953 RepID=UPI002E240F72